MRSGSLTIYMGPMFSGKSKRLVDDLTRYADSISSLKICYINTVDDKRETETVERSLTTHSSGARLSSKIQCESVKHLSEVDWTQYDILGIDEAQFFPDLHDTVIRWLADDKIVICSGLDGDFQRRPFGQLFSLIPHAESCIKLSANCVECVRLWEQGLTHTIHPAPFTKRTIASNEQILIGGKDLYVPVCRKHFY